MKTSLNVQILIGTLVGIAGGIVLNSWGINHQAYQPTLYGCEIVGGLFINLLKMILIPLIFTSITVGIANLRAHAQMSRVWKITLVYFLLTTALAILLGLLTVNLFKPGVDLKIDEFKASMASFNAKGVSVSQFLTQFLANLFINPFSAMASGSVLPTVVFALFLGIALVIAGENRAKGILTLLNEFFDLIMIMVGWIMRLAPLGIMALLAKLVATQNLSLFTALGKFIALVIGATLFHGLVTLPVILFLITKFNPFKFFMGMREAFLTAFSTSSSSATLPVTMRCVENNLKVSKDIGGFVLPLGATVNMDGTALYEAVAALFIANVAGIELNTVQQTIVFFTAMIASIGAPGIPSAGLVTLLMVLQSVGLPVEAVAILLPIDRILDALRTTVNVEGDAVGSLVVQKLISSHYNLP